MCDWSDYVAQCSAECVLRFVEVSENTEGQIIVKLYNIYILAAGNLDLFLLLMLFHTHQSSVEGLFCIRPSFFCVLLTVVDGRVWFLVM